MASAKKLRLEKKLRLVVCGKLRCDPQTYSNQTFNWYGFDIDEQTWVEGLKVEEKSLEKKLIKTVVIRGGFGCAGIGSKIYFVGGGDYVERVNRARSDLYILDINDQEFYQYSTSNLCGFCRTLRSMEKTRPFCECFRLKIAKFRPSVIEAGGLLFAFGRCSPYEEVFPSSIEVFDHSQPHMGWNFVKEPPPEVSGKTSVVGYAVDYVGKTIYLCFHVHLLKGRPADLSKEFERIYSCKEICIYSYQWDTCEWKIIQTCFGWYGVAAFWEGLIYFFSKDEFKIMALDVSKCQNWMNATNFPSSAPPVSYVDFIDYNGVVNIKEETLDVSLYHVSGEEFLLLWEDYDEVGGVHELVVRGCGIIISKVDQLFEGLLLSSSFIRLPHDRLECFFLVREYEDEGGEMITSPPWLNTEWPIPFYYRDDTNCFREDFDDEEESSSRKDVDE